MKRKIFSKLLMGALLVASVSSFTSCKDYDDDINSLKESVAKAALQSNLDALSSQVATVKSTADQALTTANAAATKSELTTAQKAALDKAAEGIAAAANAQAAADAAKALAQEAKTLAESIDLSAYAKKTDVEAAAADAMTKIQTALADYWKADAIQAKLDALKQEITNASDTKIKELEDQVKNFKEAYGEIWGAVTEIALYKYDSENEEDNEYNVLLVKGRILKDKNHFTTQKINTAGTEGVNQAGDATFGKNDYFANAANKADQTKTFTDGSYFNFPSEIVVRVSPTNAELKADQLKFIDSQGNDISSVVAVTKVTPYTDVLTRGGSASGLWTVQFSLVGDKLLQDLYAVTKAYAPTMGVDPDGIIADRAFAIAVGNTEKGAAERAAVSEYNIAFRNVVRYVGNYSLNDMVLRTDLNWWATRIAVADISNRINGDGGQKPDYSWSDDAATSNDVTADTKRAGAYATYPNNLHPTTGAYKVENGQTIYLDFNNFGTAAAPIAETDIYTRNILAKQERPKYVYIIRDDKNANVTNDASEINAWVDYEYTGLNKLYDLDETPNPSFSVKIPAKYTKGDEIAFRVFAVNYDGTLVDPDGIGFNVFVGQDVNSYSTDYTFTALQEASQVLYVPFDGTKIKSNTTSATVNAAAVAPFFWNPSFGHTAASVVFGAGTGTSFAPKNAWKDVKIAKITLSATQLLADWTDDASASWTYELSSGDSGNTPDFRFTINLKKVLPTAADVKSKYSWKQDQLKNGIWTAVIYPESAANAADAASGQHTEATHLAYTNAAPWNAVVTNGYKGINNSINKLVSNDGTAILNSQFVFTFENALYNANTKDFTDKNIVQGTHDLTDVNTWTAPTLVKTWKDGYVDGYILNLTSGANKKIAALIDNTTQHNSSIAYNFGRVSSNSVYTDADVNAGATPGPKDYVVVAEEFKTVFACPFHNLNDAKILPYTGGKKANADGDLKPIEQAWNYVIYDDPKVGKDMYGADGNATVYYDGTNIVTDGVQITSKVGAQLVVNRLKDVLTHFKSIKSAKFISNGTKTEDYFTVTVTNAATDLTLTRISGTQDPGVDVPSTLTIVGVCPFNHEHTINIPFTVKTKAVH